MDTKVAKCCIFPDTKVAKCCIFPVVMLGVFLRIAISFGPHSGQSTPPMFGDYEAQRHWQEITYNLPLDEWYVNSTENNLLYWGLDYPPLTAYHSKVLGHLANYLNPKWVELGVSRGEESYAHKVYMRCTVLAAELLYLVPITLLTLHTTTDTTHRIKMLLLMMVSPAQPLIDHGHFQYNNLSLGLTLLAVYLILQHRVYWGSAMFVLALNYKQMSLYHAVPFFCYLLGPRYHTLAGIKQVIKIGSVVVLTFCVCWVPFARSIPDVVIRMFPFSRGLFEDKVGNFWCSLSLIFKIQNVVEQLTLVRLALFATIVAVMPSQFHLFRNPTPDRFILALTNSALGFFLFSFHVHEKTILIPAATVLLLYNECPVAAIWFQLIATFSMWPLLLRDGQYTMYVGSMGLYLALGYVLYLKDTLHCTCTRVLFAMSVCGCVLLHVAELLVTPPARYPYLYPTLNAAYSAAHFGLFFCYFHYLQISGLPGLFPKSVKKD